MQSAVQKSESGVSKGQCDGELIKFVLTAYGDRRGLAPQNAVAVSVV